MKPRQRTVLARLLMLVWLLLMWALLWGTFDPLTVLSGLAVSLVVYIALRLPPAAISLRIRPIAAMSALAELAYDLFVSSAVISWHAVRHPGTTTGAILAVGTRSESDIVLVLVNHSITVRPGSVVLDLDRSRSVFYVHAMPVKNRTEAEMTRRRIFDSEARTIRAFGSPRDIRVLEERRDDDARPKFLREEK